MLYSPAEVACWDDYKAGLKQRLADANISHGALARAMGKSATTIARLMNTDLDPRLSTILLVERSIEQIVRERRAKR